MGDQFILHHQWKPIMKQIVYNHIKESGQDYTYLGCPPSHLEEGYLVHFIPSNDLLLLQKIFQEPTHVWPSDIALQGHQETAPVHNFIGFSEVQKTQEEWVLINTSQLLSKFELQDGCTHSPNPEEAMEDVVESDT